MTKGIWKLSRNLVMYLLLGIVFFLAIIAVLMVTTQINASDRNLLESVSWLIGTLEGKL